MYTTEFKVGDKVWLDASDIATTYLSQKFAHKHLGPFRVIKVIGNGAYKLQLPTSLKCLHPVFPVIKLALAKKDLFTGHPKYTSPPPVLVEDGVPEWEVEAILDAKPMYRGGHLCYLVKYKGCYDSHNEWMKHTNVFALDVVKEFYVKYPGKPQVVNAALFDSLLFRDLTAMC
jgi:hypothetical protein